MYAMQAPRIEMEKFSGRPLDYARFIRSFEMNVQRVCKDPGQLLVRLMSLCEGEAAKALEPCMLLPPREGWEKAVRVLERRFGGDTLVSTKWIDRLSSAKNQTVRQMADEWSSCLTALTSLGRAAEVNHPELSLIHI